MSRDKTLLCFRPENLNYVWKRDGLQHPVVGFWLLLQSSSVLNWQTCPPPAGWRVKGERIPDDSESIRTYTLALELSNDPRTQRLGIILSNIGTGKTIVFPLITTSLWIWTFMGFSKGTLNTFRRVSLNKYRLFFKKYAIASKWTIFSVNFWCGDKL